MQRIKMTWKKLPDSPRRILTFILGVMLIITAGILGPLPGPGGMILFLLGIAVLATEFTWAERLRDYLLDLMRHIVAYIRKHPRLTTAMVLLSVTVIASCAYVLYMKII